MSALDLFASALGAFIVLAVVALPFFPNTSHLDEETLLDQIEAAKEERDALQTNLDNAQTDNERRSEALQRFKVEDMDIVLALDGTSRMGETVEQIRTETEDLIRILRRMAPSLGVGVVAFGAPT